MIMVQNTIGMDILHSFILILSSLLIYLGTKELYELTNHKGIKYFRLSFMFFALTYFLRFIAQFLLLVLEFPRNFQSYLGWISLVVLFLFIYTSTAAILYLGASVQWKWFNKTKYRTAFLHLLALLVALIGINTDDVIVILIAQGLVILTLAITIYQRERQSKRPNQKLYLLYSLVAVFWILNVLDLIIPDFFQLTKLFIYLASIAIFQTLLYRVLKKIGR